MKIISCCGEILLNKSVFYVYTAVTLEICYRFLVTAILAEVILAKAQSQFDFVMITLICKAIERGGS